LKKSEGLLNIVVCNPGKAEKQAVKKDEKPSKNIDFFRLISDGDALLLMGSGFLGLAFLFNGFDSLVPFPSCLTLVSPFT
jgi:hypothetical protein